VLAQLRDEGRDPVVVDAGNLLWASPTIPAAERPQAELKAALIAEALALGGVDAMAPGAGDLAFGVPQLRAWGTAHALPWVAANLMCDGAAPFPPWREVTREGRTWRLVGVVGRTAKAEGCTVGDAAPAVRAALDGVDADTVVVVLSNQPVADARTLAGSTPGVRLVVSGQDRQERDPPEALADGGLLLSAGSRGKHLGRLDITWQPGATGYRDDAGTRGLRENVTRYEARVKELRAQEAGAIEPARTRHARQAEFYGRELDKARDALARAEADGGARHRATHRLIELSEQVPDHPATAALVQATKARIAALSATQAADARTAGAFVLADSPYLGSAGCVGCHTGPATQWQATPHAHALRPLAAVDRATDDACWSCHVTGAGQPGGPTRATEVVVAGAPGSALAHVGCEACHGPGRAHAADPKRVRPVRVPAVETCTGCHDGVRDEGRFDPATYLSKVAHGD
jgi:hypothetical protein